MKPRRALEALWAVPALAGCGEKAEQQVAAEKPAAGEKPAAAYRKLVRRNNLAYEKYSDTPFTGINVGYYQNGRKKMEHEFLNGKEDGKQTSWYENGQKESETRYRGGIPVGKWVYWHQNGQKKTECERRDEAADETWTHWDENGVLIQ